MRPAATKLTAAQAREELGQLFHLELGEIPNPVFHNRMPPGEVLRIVALPFRNLKRVNLVQQIRLILAGQARHPRAVAG